MIVLEGANESLPDMIIAEANRRLLELSENAKYRLQISAGYTSYRTSDTIPDILKAADRELYRNKNEKNNKLTTD